MRSVSRPVWVALTCALFASSASAAIVVETFTGSVHVDVTMPGTQQGGSAQFQGPITWTGIDFTPGAVTFNGQPVDFDGKEPQWLGSPSSGSLIIPIQPGQAVPATGTLSTPAPVGPMQGTLDFSGLRLGPTFSPNSFDWQNGSSFSLQENIVSWNSGAVPGLNGRQVQIRVSCTLTSVDPVNGIADFNVSGDVVADPQVPGATPIGWTALALALLSAGALAVGMRTRTS
ncbi:MAG TPA: hypothetical protein VGK89_14880 [Candidatus Eisenbacteria bacterium]|jgi:hypothetical protein